MSATSSQAAAGDTDDVLGHARTHAILREGSLLQRLVATDATTHAAVARLALGLFMLPHALQKTTGWFDGAGFAATYRAFLSMGIPGPLAFLAIIGELLASVALILGALTRVGAAVIIAIMIGAIATVHAPHGYFMNWSGTKAGEGFEVHLLVIGLALVTLLAGGGRASVDRGLMRWRPAPGGSVSPAM